MIMALIAVVVFVLVAAGVFAVASLLCERPDGNTTASNGSSRGSTAAIVKPEGSTAGISLLLCTARSMSSRSNASSISFTKSRLPPTSDSGASCRRSPAVLMTMMRHDRPPAS